MLTFLQLGRLGRLGNQMFQIASTIGIATKYGYGYAFPYWKNYDHAEPPFEGENKKRYFEPSAEDIDVQKYFKKPLPLLPEQISFADYIMPWGYRDIKVPDNISFKNCHMQSEKYFSHCKDLIRSYFEIDPAKLEPSIGFKIPMKAYLTEDGFPGGDKVVGIHLRIGDYALKNGYHPVQPLDYYKQAIEHFPADANFVIFSDEPQKAYQLFSGLLGDRAMYFTGNHYMTDLYFMTKCTDFIISNSTFSWWGAWLIEDDDKKIIAPKNWFGPEAGGLSSDDIYCKGWIVV